MSEPVPSPAPEPRDAQAEIVRLNKIIRALMDRSERSTSAQGSDFSMFERTIMLEEQVRRRTADHQTALREIEEMNRALRAAQAQLVDSARQAGMAEIATNVLHNVGNALNSVNVSANLACQKVRGSKSAGFMKVVDLINAHAEDLGDFLTNDARGKALPTYLSNLASTLESERESIDTELQHLTKNVAHIKDIVAAQQSLARAPSVVESVRVSDLVQDALRMAGVDEHDVKVARDFGDDPLLVLDRHRVLLILLNLIGNAMHAMKGSLGRPRELSLRSEVSDGHGVSITVADAGVGVPPENLTRIFVHGFTTHANGHGFGLHSSALAAKEMGVP
ncbi:MAG TPA: ATP-binding protein [Dermatophilaceae bacterium]